MTTSTGSTQSPAGGRDDGTDGDVLPLDLPTSQAAVPAPLPQPTGGWPGHASGLPALASAGPVLTIPRMRLRPAIPIDVVVFASTCPACGGESVWTEEREDTRMKLAIDCAACGPEPTPQRVTAAGTAD